MEETLPGAAALAAGVIWVERYDIAHATIGSLHVEEWDGLATLVRLVKGRHYPEASVDIDLSGRRVDLVAEGFDFALRGGALEDSSLIVRKLAVVELQLFASPAYLAERGTPKKVKDLAEHECILFRPTSDTKEWTFAGGRKAEAVQVTGRLRSGEFAFIRSACVAGLGIARMPSHLGTMDGREGELVRVLPKRHCNRGGISLMYPSARHLPAKARAFRDHVIAAFETSPWQLD